MVSDIELGRDSIDIQDTIRKIEIEFRSKPQKSDFAYDTSKINSLNLGEMNEPMMNPSTRRDDYRNTYNSLLNGKVDSDTLREGIINFSEIIMRKGTILHLELKTDKNESVSLKVIGCLPEYSSIMASWWIGKEIDSQMLERLISNFKLEMQKYRIIDVIRNGHITAKCKITSVSMGMSFK